MACGKACILAAAILLLSLVVPSLQAGTLNANEVRPVPPETATSVSAMRVGRASMNSMSAGTLDAKNPAGFEILSNGTIGGNIGGDISFKGATGVTFGGSSTESSNVHSNGDISLFSTRIEIDAETSLEFFGGDSLTASALDTLTLAGENLNWVAGTGDFQVLTEEGTATIQAADVATFVAGSADIRSRLDMEIESQTGDIEIISTGSGSIKANEVLSDSLRDTEMIAGGSFNVNAASIVDWDGGLLEILANDMAISSSDYDVNFRAASVISLRNLQSGMTFDAKDISVNAIGDSESRIDIVGTQTTLTASETLVVSAPGDEADIFIGVTNNDFVVTSTNNDVNVFARRLASFRTTDDISVKADRDVKFFVSEEDIVGATATEISFQYGDLLDVSVSEDIELVAGKMNIASNQEVDFNAQQDINLTATGLEGEISVGADDITIDTEELTVDTLNIIFDADNTIDVKSTAKAVNIRSGLNKDFTVKSITSQYIGDDGVVLRSFQVDLEANNGDLKLDYSTTVMLSSSTENPFAITADEDLRFDADDDILVQSEGDMELTSATMTVTATTAGDIIHNAQNDLTMLATSAQWSANTALTVTAGIDWTINSLGDADIIGQAITVNGGTDEGEGSEWESTKIDIDAGTNIVFGEDDDLGTTRFLAEESDDFFFQASQDLKINTNNENIEFKSGSDIFASSVNAMTVAADNGNVQLVASEKFTSVSGADTTVDAEDIVLNSNAAVDITANTDMALKATTAFQIKADADIRATAKSDLFIHSAADGDPDPAMKITGGNVLLETADLNVISGGDMTVIAGRDDGEGQEKDVSYVAKDEFTWTSVGSISQNADNDISVVSYANTDINVNADANIELSGGRDSREYLAFKGETVLFDATGNVIVNSAGSIEYIPADTTEIDAGVDVDVSATNDVTFTMDVSIEVESGTDFSVGTGQQVKITGTDRVQLVAATTIELSTLGEMKLVSGGPTSIQAGSEVTTDSGASTKYLAGRAQYWNFAEDAANALTATLDATTMLFQALDGTISLSGDEGLSATAGGDMTVTTTNNIEMEAHGGMLLSVPNAEADIKMSTTNQQGNIVFDSQYDRVMTIDGKGATIDSGAGTIDIFGAYGATFYARNGASQITASAGRIDVNGGTGFRLETRDNGGDINFTANRDMSVFAEDSITMTAEGAGAANDAFTLKASNGDVRIASGSAKDITSVVNNGGLLMKVTGPGAGTGIEATANRNFQVVSGRAQLYDAEHSIDVKTSNGPINFQATQGDVTLQSTGDTVHLDAGGDFVHTITEGLISSSGKDWWATAVNGSAFITSTGTFAQTAVKAMRISSLGDSTDPRDHALFQATNQLTLNTIDAGNPNDQLTFWATKVVEIGHSQRPAVIVKGGGDPDSTGMQVDSQGNMIINADGQIEFSGNNNVEFDADRSIAFSSDGSIVMTSTGLKDDNDNIVITSNNGNVHFSGDAVKVIASTEVNIVSEGEFLIRTIENDAQFQADDILVEAAEDIVVDVGGVTTGTFTGNVDIVGNNNVDIGSGVGTNAPITFTSKATTSVTANDIFLITTADDAQILLEAKGDMADVKFTTSNSNSDISFLSGRDWDMAANDLTFSGAGGVSFDNDVADKYASVGQAVESFFNVTSTGAFTVQVTGRGGVELDGSEEVILGTRQAVDSDVTITASGSGEFTSDNDQSYTSISDTLQITTDGEIDIESQLDTIFDSNRDTTFTANSEIQWQAGQNFIAEIEGKTVFTSLNTDPTDSHGIQFETNGNNAVMLFDSAANLDAVASTGALLRSPKISFTADNQGLVQGLGADDQGRGVWVHSVAGDVQFTSDVEGVLAGSGGEVSLHSTAGIITVTANGVDDFTNYGISVTSAGDGSDVQIRALGTTGDIDDNTNFQVLGYAQGNIRLEGYGSGGVANNEGTVHITATRNAAANGAGVADEGVLFSTNPLQATGLTNARSARRGDIAISSTGDFNVNAANNVRFVNPTASGNTATLEFNSSGPVVLNSAQADASLTGLGPQSGVLIEVDDSSQVSDIILSAPNGAVQWEADVDVMRIVADAPGGADVNFSSANGQVSLQQTAAGTGEEHGIDIHTVYGDLTIDAGYGGNVIMAGGAGVDAQIREKAFLNSVGPYQITKAGVTTQVGTSSLGLELSDGQFSLEGGSTFDIQTGATQRWIADANVNVISRRGDADFNAGEAFALTASQQMTLSAKGPTGDIFVETLNGGSILFDPGEGVGLPQVSYTELNSQAHFLIPARNTNIVHGDPCDMNREMTYVGFPEAQARPFSAGFNNNAGQSPQLCVCDAVNFSPGQWRCLRLLSPILRP